MIQKVSALPFRDTLAQGMAEYLTEENEALPTPAKVRMERYTSQGAPSVQSSISSSCTTSCQGFPSMPKRISSSEIAHLLTVARPRLGTTVNAMEHWFDGTSSRSGDMLTVTVSVVLILYPMAACISIDTTEPRYATGTFAYSGSTIMARMAVNPLVVF